MANPIEEVTAGEPSAREKDYCKCERNVTAYGYFATLLIYIRHLFIHLLFHYGKTGKILD